MIPQSKMHGFTLLEGVMVIVIIGILAALSIPSFNAYYGIKADAAARKLIADIRYIQQFSISRHDAYGLEFNVGSDSYRAFLVSSGATITDPTTRGSMVIDYTTNPEFSGINLTSAAFGGTNEVYFSSLGVPRDGNDTDLAAQGSVVITYKGYTKTVTVSPETGRATMQ